jgi:Raf kinase inhibitor-like YbhB/YbcL family protein
MAFKAWSDSIKPGESIDPKYLYNSFGCKGKNISPAINWSDEPAGTEYFAVTMYDPDAPREGGWWHWTVINIPGSVHGLNEGASNDRKLPENAMELKTTYGDAHYGGPCPPKGADPHHYVFSVYALKEPATTASMTSSPTTIRTELEAKALEKAVFTVEYGRD